MNHSEQYSWNKAYNTYAPDPEERCFDMIFNLNTCKSYSKECSRYYRTDECCTVSADNHCDCYVCRIYTKLVSDTDQNRKKSEEVRICTEQSSINLVSMQVRIASFLSGYLLVRYGSYPFSSTNFLLYATICSIMYPSSFLCFLTSPPFLFFYSGQWTDPSSFLFIILTSLFCSTKLNRY